MKLSRRKFLKLSGLALAGTSFSPLPAFATGSNDVLVVLNLRGGNDGLNTVVPLDQYDRYRELRPNLGFALEDLLPLADAPDFAFNPQLTALHRLYGEGKVAVINGVAAPQDAQGLFDHSASQYMFNTGDTVSGGGVISPTGWAGRYLDGVTPGMVPPGINMGGGSLLLTGESHESMAIDSVDDFRYNGTKDWEDRMAAYDRILQVVHSDGNAEAHRNLRIDARVLSDIIQEQTANYVPALEYPDSGLARSFRECAKLITSGMGAHVLNLEMTGYDTHASQGNSQGMGVHENLLSKLSDAIAAFHDDLAGQGYSGRVVTLVTTEFGRRAYENAGWGTDHGYSSVAFIVGNSINGGVYGDYPRLEEESLVLDGNLDMTTDFRSVYATLLSGLFTVDPVPILGGAFPQLGFL